MQHNPYVIGLSRQTKVAWLPLPYFAFLMVICVMPYFWTNYKSWLLTSPIWYGLLFVISTLTAKAHVLLNVLIRKTPHRLWKLVGRLKGKRYSA